MDACNRFWMLIVAVLVFSLAANGVGIGVGQSFGQVEEVETEEPELEEEEVEEPEAEEPEEEEEEEEEPDEEILYSASSDRSTPMSLSGATVSGDIYVFTTELGVDDVYFWIDDPDRLGQPHRHEKNAPYDLNGATAT